MKFKVFSIVLFLLIASSAMASYNHLPSHCNKGNNPSDPEQYYIYRDSKLSDEEFLNAVASIPTKVFELRLILQEGWESLKLEILALAMQAIPNNVSRLDLQWNFPIRRAYFSF